MDSKFIATLSILALCSTVASAATLHATQLSPRQDLCPYSTSPRANYTDAEIASRYVLSAADVAAKFVGFAKYERKSDDGTAETRYAEKHLLARIDIRQAEPIELDPTLILTDH